MFLILLEPQSNMEELALYNKFPQMKKLPRINLVNFPTPVEKLEETSKKLGYPELWIKRDDLTNEDYGGNKPRKFEFLLGKALKKGKREIITIGGVGSNHALANTIYCKKLGLKSRIYLVDQPLIDIVRENMLLDYFYGAKMVYNRNYLTLALKIIWRLLTNRKSFLIMPGGSVPLGTIGFVNAGLELAEQVKSGIVSEPDHLFVAVGSAGTSAGLTLGLELAGLKTKVHAVRVAMPFVTNKKYILRLAKKTLKLMRKLDKTVPDVSAKLKNRLTVHADFYGGEYGRMTQEGIEAINIIKDDGIKLDTTYTAKTFSALIDHCNCCTDDEKCEIILYWNTKNSKNLSHISGKVNFSNLPKNFHKFFNGKFPEHTDPVIAKEQKND